ncbi:hypothetical protein D3C84_1067780 [compost metagenome]
MSLLAGLLNKVKLEPARAAERAMVKDITLIAPADDQTEQKQVYLTVVMATPEWVAARDQYINHLMACRACYAPTNRYCATGAKLRQGYDQTPMERT